MCDVWASELFAFGSRFASEQASRFASEQVARFARFRAHSCFVLRSVGDLGCLLMCVCVLLVWACEPFASGPSGKSVSYVMVSLYSCHVIVAESVTHAMWPY